MPIQESPVDLVRDMIAAGVDPLLITRFWVMVSTIPQESPGLSGTVRDIVREYESSRKRRQRKKSMKSSGKQTMSAVSSDEKCPGNVPDKEKSLLSSSLLTFSNSLTEEKKAKEEVVARRDRGTRIPDNWKLSPALRDLCIERHILPSDFEMEFMDYWIAIPGARGRKLDWEATARNRIKEIGRRGRKINGKRTIMEACDDLLDRVRAFDEPAPSDLRDGASQVIVGLIPKG